MATFPGTPATNDTNAVAGFVNAITTAGYAQNAAVDTIGALYDITALRLATALNPDALIAAGASSLNTSVTTIVGPTSSTYAITLAAPSAAGMLKVITMLSTTSTNAVTLALTNCVGGTAATSASFDAAGETLILVSRTDKWCVIKEVGVTLS